MYGLINASPEIIANVLGKFSCAKDADIENFIRNKAVEFEGLFKSRTYLLCDEEALVNNEWNILGYFSLSLKTLILPEDMSIRARKEIDGYRGKIHGIPIREVSCYLIGQLARNDSISRDVISGIELLKAALDVVRIAHGAVGGRYVMIECHDNKNLLEFYSNNGFKVFKKDTNNDNMVQMIKAF